MQHGHPGGSQSVGGRAERRAMTDDYSVGHPRRSLGRQSVGMRAERIASLTWRGR